jgi:uncharacterized protein
LKSISQIIAEELGVGVAQVDAAVTMLDEGSTVPFISRYRKEATGGLDDTQLRTLDERLKYLRELEERREAILKSIEEQGKLTDELAQAIRLADTKARLEDLYLPFKQKRRTKAMIAREAGLEPLADLLLGDPNLEPEVAALPFLGADKGVTDTKAALEGARHILTERFGEDADLLGNIREWVWQNAKLKSEGVKGKEQEGIKFSDYFDYSEKLHQVPSHRALALFRGRKEGFLNLSFDIGAPEDAKEFNACEVKIAARFGISDKRRPADRWLLDTVRWTWRVKISLHIELELMSRLWEAAELEAIRVFASNLRDLLLAAPAGPRRTLALDPGFRAGVKLAAIDATGKLLEVATIYPHQPQNRWDEALATLAALCARHKIELLAIGNGTASRETDKLAAELIGKYPELKVTKVSVSEAGASIYSASAYAASEMPDVDVTLRGAASIARRLQDPLAELVKIDPKAIGVGQYQHDLSEYKLGQALDTVVEDCVNRVGVDLNTASVRLLARVSGLSEGLAQNIVTLRDEKGAFARREDLKKVPRLGPKAFEQAAGFLRIMNGLNPLDRSSVHPEAYPVVERILKQSGLDARGLIGNASFLRGLNPGQYTDERFGLPTVKDILTELEKPGRDPRPEFKIATFRDGIEEMKDLKPGMMLEGVVTNVANFGAFVDIGVHQDGLVHVSALADRFIKDPREVVKPGDVVKVKVVEVDVQRKRIALTMRMTDDGEKRAPTEARRQPAPQAQAAKTPAKPAPRQPAPPPPSAGGNAFAEAFARAQKDKKK